MIVNEEEIKRQAARAVARQQRMTAVKLLRGKPRMDIVESLGKLNLGRIPGLVGRLWSSRPLSATQVYKINNTPVDEN